MLPPLTRDATLLQYILGERRPPSDAAVEGVVGEPTGNGVGSQSDGNPRTREERVASAGVSKRRDDASSRDRSGCPDALRPGRQGVRISRPAGAGEARSRRIARAA